MPDQHQQTNQSFYDRISGAYDFIADSSEHKAREMGQSGLGLKPGDRVLEIGFGTGNSMIDLAKLVGPTGKVIGVDISPGMQKVAEKKIAKTDLGDQIELHIGDARNLDFPPNSFDAAFMSFTLELFDESDIPSVLGEILKALKPGGKIGVVSMATVKTGDKSSALEKTYIWMHQHFPHIVDCQPIDVVTLVAAAGFTIEKELDMEIWSMPVRAAIGVKPE